MAEMRPVTIRFGDPSRAVIAVEAEREGVSFAQYVREAAIMRVAWERAWAASAAHARGADVMTVEQLRETAQQIMDSCE